MLRRSISRPQNPNKNPSISILSSPFSSRRKKNSAEADEHEGGGGGLLLNRDPESPPRLLVVQPRLRPEPLLRSKLSEALNLANSLEQQRDGFYAHDFASMDAPPHVLVQNPAARSARVRADTYFGHGTVDTIKCHLRALESENELDAVFVNTILSGIQQRNLEVALGKPVLDRVGLIIEIFHAHAETKEAKLQSELAALMYKRSRLVRVRGPSGRLTFGASGEAEVVSARGRGSGGRGFISGAGETELQLQRRRIHERRNHLLSQIEEVRRTRSLQRHARRRHGGSQGQSLATVAIVGYTNAGKSTLVSALSETDLYCDDRLFATVDPRLRSVVLPSGRKALLSDTVGFISDLPVQLVEAFHATLEEVVEADLLVHVLDSSAPNLDEQRSTVLQVLQQIGVSPEKIENMIEVWNKIDLLHRNIGDDETSNQDECLSEVEEEENLEEDECQLEGDGEENLEEDECLTGGEARESEGEGEGDVSFSDDQFTQGKVMSEEDECLTGGEARESEGDGDGDGDGDGSFSGDKFTQGKVMYELSSEEDMESIEDQHAYSHKQPEMTGMIGPCEVKRAEHLETSAVTGIGLQELLTLIDEKLNTPSSIVTRSLGPLDRKWRPSYTADTAK